MRGKKAGLSLLDLTVDGFWDSFWAIPLSLPPLLLTWITVANSIASGDPVFTLILRLALVDLVNWLLPLFLFALAARRLRLSKRFLPFVVASNWATVVLVWLVMPLRLLDLLSPQSREVAELLSLLVMILSLVLFWRLTRTTLQTDLPTTTAVYVGLNAASLFIVILLPQMLGLTFTA
ncbi:transporter [Tianweitania sediminis]|uniref:Transporter n=1 Tax=Tianweitania sediminis TaxID=1502156 RepID=A0A8J7RJN0_9HYPH|nr:transporter [Tianweitania sediminis]MBP0438486.1 transporter [Tianweitania sediminis]